MDKINGELELAKKKKQALDKLLSEGRVSKPTYDSFSDEVAEAIAEIEAKQSSLVGKMKAKVSELEQQLKTLEFLLVNSEIRHVAGEMDEEAYSHECNVLSLGLETTRQELNEIKEAISDLSEKNIYLPPQASPEAEETAQAEPEPAPETEKRLEIVMDTKTTTSIETEMETEATVEENAEVPTEQVSEQESSSEVSFRPEESPPAEEEPKKASSGEEAAQSQE